MDSDYLPVNTVNITAVFLAISTKGSQTHNWNGYHGCLRFFFTNCFFPTLIKLSLGMGLNIGGIEKNPYDDKAGLKNMCCGLWVFHTYNQNCTIMKNPQLQINQNYLAAKKISLNNYSFFKK